MRRAKKNPNVLQAPDLRGTGLVDTSKKAKLQAPDLRNAKSPVKRNPAAFVLMVQKGKGPVMTWNGERFTNYPPFHAFARATVAKAYGRRLLKHHSVLNSYRMWVSPKIRTYTGKQNPSPRVNAELDSAAKKLEDFSGHKAVRVKKTHSRSDQKTGLIVGELDLIGYRAKRDGKTERYGHHFKKNSRPLLAVSSDGKQLHVVGGRYEFTEAGIEDR